MKIKAEHEKVATTVDEAFADRAARLLIGQFVGSVNQSDSITAHTIDQNFGGFRDVESGNVIQGSKINNSFNQNYNPYHRSLLDITPSSVTKSLALKRVFQISFSILSFTSIILTIIGKNIFQIKDCLPEWAIKDVWMYGVVFIIVSVFLLLLALKLTIKGSISLFAQCWVVIDKAIIHMQFRCICPFSECGGVMEPKFTGNDWLWVCRRNHKHRMDFDGTQIASAIEKGQLNPKIKAVI